MSFWIIGISTAVSLAGTAVSVYGQQQQAEAAEATARYNADVQRRQAEQENAIAAENSRRKARENARELSRLRAANAANGLAMEGTPLAVLGEVSTALERDLQDLSYEANSRYQSLVSGASLSLWEGSQQASALKTQSYATALQGAGSAASGFLTSSGQV